MSEADTMDDDTTKGMPLERWERWFLAALVLVSLALRGIYLLEIRNNPFFDHPRLDALFHDKWAESIAAGDIVGEEVFFRAPAYPYFLGGLYALFGHNYVVPRVVQHLIGILSLVFLYLLSRRLCGRGAAVLASSLASLYAVLIYFEGELLFDSLLVFACLAWLLLVERYRPGASPVHWLMIGAVYGVVCCIRPPFLAIAPFIFAGLVWRVFRQSGTRTAAKAFAILSLGCAMPILPITVRNYIVGHDLVLIASQGGVNFYIGNNPDADGHSSMMPGRRGASWENRQATFMAARAIGHSPTPSEESWFWYKQGLAFVVEQPVQYLALLLKKAYLFWNWYEIPNNQSFYSFQQYSKLLQILPVGFWLVGPLGLLGIAIALGRKRLLFQIEFVALYSAVIILFFVCDRFRLPIVPLLCMFSGYALVAFYDTVRRKQWKSLARVTGGALCTALLVNSNLYAIERDVGARDFLSLGIVELEKKNYDSAIAFFQQASEHSEIPPPNLNLNWGVAEWERGNIQNAVARFRQELVLYPDAHGAMSNLSYIFLEMGKTDSAILFGTAAVKIKPYLSKPYLAIAQAYQKQHQLDSAVIVLESGLRSCDGDFLEGELLLADAFNSLGRTDSAERHYRAVLDYRERAEQPSYEPDLNFSRGGVIGGEKGRLQATALYGLGHVWAARRGLDSAAFYFREATFKQTDYGDAWADLGIALMQMREYSQADSALENALTLQPTNHLYWYNYGTLLGMSGRLADAQQAFEKSLGLHPGFEPARRSLAITSELMKSFNRDQAR